MTPGRFTGRVTAFGEQRRGRWRVWVIVIIIVVAAGAAGYYSRVFRTENNGDNGKKKQAGVPS